MSKWKRSSVVYFALDDEAVFRLDALLQGRIEKELRGRFYGLDLLSSQRRLVSEEQVQFLLSLPSDHWVESEEVRTRMDLDPEALQPLIEAGWLLTDGTSVEERRARSLDESLENQFWHPDALVFHRMARLSPDRQSGEFSELHIGKVASRSAELAAEFVERHGEPPEAHVRFRRAAAPVGLPAAAEAGVLTDLLRRRTTVRSFDVQTPLPAGPLSTLLKFTFGQLADVELTPGLQLVKKGSPSGGSLHPIEAFPLILHVEGLTPGLYHYQVADHRLQPLTLFSSVEEGRQLASRIGAGQLYIGEAHVVVLMAARFERNHWKYRRQSRTYSVMLMDAGHLSQTFYLLATQLGLGAFFSAALDSELAEETLGLPAESYGPLAVCGCGLIGKNEDVPHQGSLPFVANSGEGPRSEPSESSEK